MRRVLSYCLQEITSSHQRTQGIFKIFHKPVRDSSDVNLVIKSHHFANVIYFQHACPDLVDPITLKRNQRYY